MRRTAYRLSALVCAGISLFCFASSTWWAFTGAGLWVTPEPDSGRGLVLFLLMTGGIIGGGVLAFALFEAAEKNG